MQHISSKLIHGKLDNDTADNHRSLKTPIYETASFDFKNSEEMEDAFKGNSDAFAYSRISNPTVSELQQRLKVLSGSEDTLCMSSGMAAISNVFLTLCSSGDNIITSKYLFGNTFSFFANTLESLGVEARFTDFNNLDDIKRNCNEQTRAIFMEIPTNPQLILFDIEKIAEWAEHKNIVLVIDNSILTPYLFQASNYKIDIELFSNTKFISGGATSIGGTIQIFKSEKWKHIPKLRKEYDAYGSRAFYKRLYKEIYRNMGSCLSPQSAWLQILGLETLILRVDKTNENALIVAKHLKEHKKVTNVHYLSLPCSPYYERTKKYFRGEGGCLINLNLGNKQSCYDFMDALKMIRRGTNFCDNKSMIIHPSSTIYWDFKENEKEEMKIDSGMLRLSIGIENVDDIINDLNQALDKI